MPPARVRRVNPVQEEALAAGLKSVGKAGRRQAGPMRRALHRFVPVGFHDPIGLARRLVRSRDPAALFALRAAAIGPALLPIDLLLTPFEHLRYRNRSPPRLPIIVVCGCARSGTTVAAQLLMHRLPVSHFTNLTSVFPRAPLTAEATIGRLLPKAAVTLHNFYGRTSGWNGSNDGLYLWDRWLGSDRGRIPETLVPGAREAMAAFFGARERQMGCATLVKVNALNACAHLVADALPTARFICIERHPVEHALSLLNARVAIHGRPDIPYGLAPPSAGPDTDPIESVCRQVLFHEEIARRQAAHLGPERFRVERLEEICRRPDAFVERTGRELLGVGPGRSDTKLRPDFRTPADSPEKRKLVARIEQAFERLGGTAS